MRYKLTLAYRGTHYHGWQTQAMNPNWTGPAPEPGEGIPTIQEKLKRAITAVVRHEVSVAGSSRTDAGVHAKGQVAHFDTDKTQIPIEALRQSINAKLPGDILVRKIEAVSDQFDAVYSTLRKRYQYVIWNAADRPPFFHDLVWHRWQELNIGAMQSAATLLEGEHDFASFAPTGPWPIEHGAHDLFLRRQPAGLAHRDRRRRQRIFMEHGPHYRRYIGGSRFRPNPRHRNPGNSCGKGPAIRRPDCAGSRALPTMDSNSGGRK